MKIQYLIFFGLFFTVYGSINLYIGVRGWEAFSRLWPQGCGVIYWAVFIALALSFIAGRLAENYLPGSLAGLLTGIGSYWLAAMNYLFFTLVLIDIVRLLHRKLNFIPASVMQRPELTGLAVVLLVTGIIIFGAWNARHPRLVHYDITIPKSAGSLSELHIVAVSDIHLGKIIHNGRLLPLVQQVSNLNPDLILLPGDTVEESVTTFTEQNMSDSLRMLEAKYGTFAIFGNHEYVGGQAEDIYRHLQEAGITVLRDEYQKIAGSFYLVGRDYQYGERFGEAGSQELSQVMVGLDRLLPVIMLDHQPSNLVEGQKQGVDLQISGHTHLGQLFPLNIFTGLLFETDWGHLRKGDFQLIVTCGFGTWGPPIRVGNVPEIVDIDIHFTGPPGQGAGDVEPVMRTMGRLW
ncbi:MAG: metallophosphoesterase [Desulfotomaculaceae bacterium]|nr:metallophosphoesterase [Desulfotomaculaceae bacterium]MDD4766384.1 metallophosphoesterase [Desulfotomaculaceae bacterium]